MTNLTVIQSSELEMIQSDPAASDMILQSVSKMLLDVKIDTVCNSGGN